MSVRPISEIESGERAAYLAVTLSVGIEAHEGGPATSLVAGKTIRIDFLLGEYFVTEVSSLGSAAAFGGLWRIDGIEADGTRIALAPSVTALAGLTWSWPKPAKPLRAIELVGLSGIATNGPYDHEWIFTGVDAANPSAGPGWRLTLSAGLLGTDMSTVGVPLGLSITG